MLPAVRGLVSVVSLRRGPVKEFTVEQAHHDIVVPGSVDKGSLALSPLHNKTALLIRPDRSFVVAEHTYANSMKPHRAKGVPQKKVDCLAAKPTPEHGAVEDSDCH
ncbi:hypothetical protein J2Z50_001516 [Ensifer mexicanus]|nr:hypothetical protein [Sinorhizobium mexicanum]